MLVLSLQDMLGKCTRRWVKHPLMEGLEFQTTAQSKNTRKCLNLMNLSDL